MVRPLACVGIVYLLGSLYSPQLVAEELTHPVDAIWQEIWKGSLVKAEAEIDRLDAKRYRNEIELFHGAVLWEKKDYKQAIQILSRIKPVYDERQEKISTARISSASGNQAASDDELNYFRLYTYLALSKAGSGQMNEDVEADFIRVLSNPPIAAQSTRSNLLLDTLTYFGATELVLGRYERALGSFLQAHYIMKGGSALLNSEYARAGEYNVACAYAKLHQPDMAIVWLKKSLSSNLESRWATILSDHDLDDIRHDQKFLDFIKERQSDVR